METIKSLSTQGILNILNELDHVSLFGDETREELEQILFLNLESGVVDEVVIIMELNAE